MMGFMDGSGISWTICKQSAPRSRQITTTTPHHPIFYRLDALSDAQPTYIYIHTILYSAKNHENESEERQRCKSTEYSV